MQLKKTAKQWITLYLSIIAIMAMVIDKSNAQHKEELPPMAVALVNQWTCKAPCAVKGNADRSTGKITRYVWNFGDGDTSEQTSFIHVYDVPAEYAITLTIYCSDGQQRHHSVRIKVME